MGHIVISWIGNKIKSLRSQKNLSLNELSKQSRISKSLLSKIENSRTVPSLPVFIGLLEALDIAPKDFFEDMYLSNGKNYTLVKKHDQTVQQRENRQGFEYRTILNHSLSNFSIEIVHLHIEPHAKYEPTVTDGYEFKYMLKGQVEYMIGEESCHMEEGDSLFFDARTPHYPKTSNLEASILVVYFLFS